MQDSKAVLNSNTYACVYADLTLLLIAKRGFLLNTRKTKIRNRVPGVCDCILDTLQLDSFSCAGS